MNSVIITDEFGRVTSDRIIKVDYDGGSNPVYIGEAKPGTATSEKGWRIKKISWDASNNPTEVLWANGSNAFAFVWDDRASYSYS